jgi:hypothetical protein
LLLGLGFRVRGPKYLLLFIVFIMASSIVWEGYLVKRGSRIKSWLRRWFELDAGGAVLRCA